MPEQPPVLLKRSRDHFRRRRPARLSGNPEVRIRAKKSGRDDTNQCSRYAIEHKRLVYNSRISTKALHPSLVPQHEYRRRSRLVIRRLYHPPHQRRHSQKLKRSRRHEVPVEALRPLSRPVQDIRLIIADRPVKHIILLQIVQKLWADEGGPPPA